MRSTRLRHRLILSTALHGGLLLAAAPVSAQASQPTLRLPSPSDVVSSSGINTPVLSAGDTRLDVGVATNGATIDWKQFDIPNGSSINFNDETGGGGTPVAVLNRVVGDGGTITRSTIDGLLRSPSNMAVFLINSSGITFGPRGVVNVGSLIASTLDLSPADFAADVAAGRYSFAGSGSGDIKVAGGARLFATGSAAAGLGNLVLLGAKVAVGRDSGGTAATLLARKGVDPDAATIAIPTGDDGDVALVAADDVTVEMGTGSPLSIAIAKGTAVEGAFKVDGSIAGRNVTLALATRGGVTDTLLSVAGMTTATGAMATDRGVVLTAGRDLTGIGAGGVTLAPTAPANLDLAGAIRTTAAIGSGSGLSIAAAGSVTVAAATVTPTLTRTIDVARDYVVTGSAVTLGTADTPTEQVAGGKVTIEATGGDVVGQSGLTLRSDAIGGGNAPLTIATSSAAGGTIGFAGATLQGGTSRQSAVRIAPGSSANIVTLGNVSASELQGNIVAGSYQNGITRDTTLAFGTLDLASALIATSTGGDIRLGGAAIGAGQGITLSAANGELILPATLSASASIALTTGAALTTESVTSSGGTVSVNTGGNALSATSLTSATGLTIAAGGGAVTLGSGAAGTGPLSITADTLDSGTGATDLSTTGAMTLTLGGAGRLGTLTAGSIDASAASIELVSATAPGNIALTTGGALNFGTVSAGDVAAGTGTASLTAGGALTGTLASGVGGVTASGVSANVDQLVSDAGGIALTTTGGDATLGSATTRTGVTVAATGGAARVTGVVEAGGNYTVSGIGVTLGNGAATLLQAANGTVSVTATNGTLAAGRGLTLRANADESGAEALTLTTDGSSGGDIAFAGGLQAGPTTSAASTLTVRSRSFTNAVTLGDIVALRLTGAAGGAPNALGLTRNAAIRTGAVTLGQSLVLSGTTIDTGAATASLIDLSAQGALTATSLLATDGLVFLSGTGDTNVTGAIATTGANSDIRVDRTGMMQFGSLSATQDLLIGQNGGVPTTLTVTGTTGADRDLTIDSSDTQTFTGAVTAGRDLTLTGGALVLNGATATTGALALTATASDLTVATLNAGTDALLIASGTARVTGAVELAGDYNVTGGSVILGSAGATPTQRARGSVAIVATAGTTTGLAGLTLQSDYLGQTGGNLALATTRAGDAIDFGRTTLLAGNGTLRPAVLVRSASADGAVTLGTVRAGRLLGAIGGDAFTTGLTRNAAITVGDVTLGGGPAGVDSTLRLDTGSATLTTGTLSASTIALNAGNIALGGIVGTSTATLTGTGALTAGDITGVSALTIDRSGSVALTGVSSSGDIQIGRLVRPVTIITTGALTSTGGAVRLTSSGAQTLGGALVANGAVALAGGSITAGAITSTTGAIGLTATGAVQLYGATSAGDTVINADGLARVTGDVTSGADYRVTGSGVVLGDGSTASVQGAVGSIRLLATAGILAGGNGLTLQSDRAGTGAGTLVLDGAGGIALDPATVLLGGVGLGSGDIGLRTGNGAVIALGTVTARRLSGADNAGALTATLLASGALDLAGTITTTGTFNSSVAGTITTRRIDVTGAGGDLILASTGTYSDLITLGPLTAARDIALTGQRDVGFTTLTAGRAAVAIATNGALTGTMLTGATTARAVAAGALSLTSLVGRTGAEARGATVTLNDASTMNGLLTLTAITGDMVATSAASTSGAVALSASGDITLGSGSAGSDLSILDARDVGGISAGTRTTLSAGRDVVASARGTMRGAAFTVGRDLALTADNLDLLTGRVTGGSATISAGSATIATLTARNATITTTGNAVLGMIDTSGNGGSGDLAIGAGGQIKGGSDTRTILTAGRNLMLSAGGAALLGTVVASGQALLGAASLDLSTLTAATGTITAAAGDAIAGTITTTGTLDYNAATTARIGAIDAGGAITVAASAIDLGTIRGREEFAATSRLAELNIADLSSRGSVVIRAATDAVLGQIASTGGELNIEAGGTLGASGLTAPGAIAAQGTTITIDRIAGAANVAISATSGDLSLLETSGTSGVSLIAAQDLRTGSVTATGTGADLSLSAGGQIVGGNGVLTAARNLTLTADGAVALGAVVAGGQATIGSASLDLSTLTAASAAIATTSGDAIAGTLTTTGTLDYDAATTARIGTIDAGGAITVAGRAVDLGTIRCSEEFAAISRLAELNIADLSNQGSVVIRAATDAVLGQIASTGGELDVAARGTLGASGLTASGSITAKGATVTIDRIAGAANVAIAATSGDLSLLETSGTNSVSLIAARDLYTTTVTASGTSTDLSLTAGGRIDGGSGSRSSLSVGRNLTLAAGGAALLGSVAVGGEATLGAASLDLSTLTAAHATITTTAGDAIAGTLTTTDVLDYTAKGLVRIGMASAGGFASIRGGSVNLTRLAANGASITTTAGNVIAGSLTINGGLTLMAADALTADRLNVAGRLLARGGSVSIAGSDVGSADIASAAGDLDLTRLTTGGSTTLDSFGSINFGMVSAGDTLTASAMGDIIGRSAATLTSTAGAVTVSTSGVGDGGGAIRLNAITAATDLTVTGRQIAVTNAIADKGSATLSVRGHEGATTTGIVADRVEAGEAATLSASRGTIAPASASNGAIRLGSATARGGTLRLSAEGDLRGLEPAIGDRDFTGTALTATGAIAATIGGIVELSVAQAGGDLSIDAGELRLVVAKASGAMRATTGYGATIGSVIADSVAITTRTGTLNVTSASATDALTLTSGTDLTLENGIAGGPATFAAIGTGRITGLQARDATILGNTLRLGRVVTGAALTATSGSGGAMIGTVATGTTASFASDDTLAIGSVASDGAIVATALGALTADSLTSGLATNVTAQATAIRAVYAGEALNVTNGTGALAIDQSTAGTTARITTIGDANVNTLTAGQDLTLIGQHDAALGTIASTGGAAALSTAGKLTATGLSAARSLAVAAGSATIGTAVAGEDVSLSAASGDLSLASLGAGKSTITATESARIHGAVEVTGELRVRAGTIALGTQGDIVRQQAGGISLTASNGSITGLGALTLSAGGVGMALTATGSAGAVDLAATTALDSGGMLGIETAGTATLGSVTNQGRAITVSASDIALAGSLAADTITLVNRDPARTTRLGDLPVDNEEEFGSSSAARFDLTSAEIGRLAANQVIIDAQTGPVTIGDVALPIDSGRTLFQVRTSGQMDVLGRFVATGPSIARTVVLGGGASADARASSLRVAASAGAGGRLLVGNGTLDLRANAIGVGLDRGFLDALGFDGSSSSRDIAVRYVSQPGSGLYNASQANPLGSYSDPLTVQAGRLIVRYGDYALFQNTGVPGTTSGVAVGGIGQQQSLQLLTTAPVNAVALFGSINGVTGNATSSLPVSAVVVSEQVLRANSRLNGCLIGSEGCTTVTISRPTFNSFDQSRLVVFQPGAVSTSSSDAILSLGDEALLPNLYGVEAETFNRIGLLQPPAPCLPRDKTCSADK